MKKIVLIFASLILLVLTMPLFSSFAGSSYIDGYVYDETKLLSESEKELINSGISAADLKCYIIFTNSYIYPYDLKRNAEYYLDKMNAVPDCAVLTVDLDERVFDIFTFGSARKIKNSEINYMIDSLSGSMRKGEYANAARSFVSQAQTAYNGRLGVSIFKIVLVSFIIGIAVAAVVCGCVIAAYKKKMRQTKYPLEKYTSYDLVGQSDKHMGTSVTAIPIRSEKSGGGGGSSHRGRGRF